LYNLEYRQGADYRLSEIRHNENRKNGSKLPLNPSFVNFGLDGAITALTVVDDPYAPDEAEDEFLLLVGTATGEVFMSDILSRKSLGLVHRESFRSNLICYFRNRTTWQKSDYKQRANGRGVFNE
jgi:hypothetical protein